MYTESLFSEMPTQPSTKVAILGAIALGQKPVNRHESLVARLESGMGTSDLVDFSDLDDNREYSISNKIEKLAIKSDEMPQHLAMLSRDQFDKTYSADRYKIDGLDIIKSFSDVEPEAVLVATIIGQARADSMPTPIFKPKSKEALFNSELPESYDGFDFMMSDRLNIYAETIGMEARMIRNDWLKLYAIWHKDQGSAVFMNIMNHTIKLLATCKPNTAIHMDASSFCRSPQFTYWCKVGGKKPDEVRAWITDETMNRIKMMPEAKFA